MAFPAGWHIFGELLQKIQGFNHRLVGEMRTIFFIEENAAVCLRQLTHQNVNKKIVAGNRQTVNIRLAITIGIHGQLFGKVEQIIPGLGTLQPFFLGQIFTVDQQ